MAEDKENPFNIPDSLTSGNINQVLVNAAYTKAKLDQQTKGKLIQNLAFQGLNTFAQEYQANQAMQKAEHEAAMADVEKSAEQIYESAGSLPQMYFDQSYKYVGQLRNEYEEAVKNGNTKEQHLIKGKLNQFVTYIGGLKTTLNDNAEIITGDDKLAAEHLTPEQIQVQRSCVNENAVLVDGEFKYKAVDGNGLPIMENGKQKYYTVEDLNNSIITKDYTVQETYLDNSNKIAENGEKFKNGESEEDFNRNTQYRVNEKLITKDNIQYMMKDDFFNDKTFAETFGEHPDFNKLFKTIERGGSLDGNINQKVLKKWDKDGSGFIGETDFITLDILKGLGFEDPTPEDHTITEEDLLDLKDWNPELQDELNAIIIQEITKHITNPTSDLYDFNTSRAFLAEFMTLRDEKTFYGDIEAAKLLVPGATANSISKAKLQSMSYQEYIDEGGNVGYLKSQGWVIDKRGYPDRPEKWRWKQKEGIETWNKGIYDTIN